MPIGSFVKSNAIIILNFLMDLMCAGNMINTAVVWFTSLEVRPLLAKTHTLPGKGTDSMEMHNLDFFSNVTDVIFYKVFCIRHLSNYFICHSRVPNVKVCTESILRDSRKGTDAF